MSDERPGGYQRSTSGLVGAMIVLLVVVAGYVGLRAFSRDDAAQPTPVVDRATLVQVAGAARDQGGLVAPAPDPVPEGWKVTSVRYLPGKKPVWHLGMLTDAGAYVGMEEKSASVSAVVDEFIDADAQAGKPVRIEGRRWESWTDEGGDYGLTSRVAGRTVLVGGSAPARQVRDLVAGLRIEDR